ncbi:MAG TPA: hypothetical protein H9848_07590, partial [Candidatus Parabacteroides intestinigallinarum]|nr:hypothetical protein [Candidatus Parabacteroides intestinigallinarum]
TFFHGSLIGWRKTGRNHMPYNMLPDMLNSVAYRGARARTSPPPCPKPGGDEGILPRGRPYPLITTGGSIITSGDFTNSTGGFIITTGDCRMHTDAREFQRDRKGVYGCTKKALSLTVI